jgi:uncharacterized protein YaiL (DUF2058 family)
VGDQAEFELIHNIVGTDHSGDPILHEDGAFSEQMQVAHEADPVKHGIVTAEKVSQNAMARQIYGKPLRQLSQLQRRTVRKNLVELASEATVEIPIHVPEVAHAEVQKSMKQDVENNPALSGTFSYLEKKYGAKIEDVLVKEEQDAIARDTGIVSTQGATKRAAKAEVTLAEGNKRVANNEPIKLKSAQELAATKVEKQEKTRAQQFFNQLEDTGNLRYNSGDQGYNVKFLNPVDKALYKLNSASKRGFQHVNRELDRLGKYFDGTKTKEEIFDIGRQVKEQLDAAIRERRPKYHGDIANQENLTFPKMFEHVEKVKADIKAQELKNADIPKSYVSFKKQTVAHFINPFADRAKQAKKSLDKFLDGMADDDFIQEISDQMGNQIHFEKPYDMLLWGLHHSDAIPSSITKKIKSVLHDQDPGGTYAEWKDEARRLSAHVDMLAMSGRLDVEGNVFRSTITTSFTGRTRWQREAEKEAAVEEIENFKNTMGPYAKNFKSEYQAGLKELVKLQTLRRQSKTDESFFKSHDKIKKILEDAENR